jgi:hypothetical protein
MPTFLSLLAVRVPEEVERRSQQIKRPQASWRCAAVRLSERAQVNRRWAHLSHERNLRRVVDR